MQIAFVSSYDATDIRLASGSTCFISRALTDDSHSVIHIGPLGQHHCRWRWLKGVWYQRVAGKRYHHDRDPLLARAYGREIAARLAEVRPDVVFATETVPLAYLETDRPVVLWADATFGGLRNFYGYFSNLCAETERTGMDLETRAIACTTLALYSSEWAAQTAIREHGADPEKVRVVPWGANIDGHRTCGEIERLLDARPRKRCRLLFVGVDWERKGAALAVEVARWLNAHGVPAKLTMVGCLPLPGVTLPGYVRTPGFISKTSHAGREQLEELYGAAHFVLGPSRAECCGIAFAEANSFGVPARTTDVGGIATMVANDVNGRTFPLTAQAAAYGAYVAGLMADESRYRTLARRAFGRFRERFNWDVAGREVKALLARL